MQRPQNFQHEWSFSEWSHIEIPTSTTSREDDSDDDHNVQRKPVAASLNAAATSTRDPDQLLANSPPGSVGMRLPMITNQHSDRVPGMILQKRAYMTV